MNLYYSLTLNISLDVQEVGGFEAWTPVCMEPALKYHPLMFDVLTWTRDPGCGQCLVGSLTARSPPKE